MRDLRSVPAVTPDDATDATTDRLPVLERAHQVRAHVLLAIAATDREHEQHVFGAQLTHREPRRERGLPAVVVHARSRLGYVVGRRVRLDAADLAEIVDGVRGVARATAHAEHE